MGKRPLYVLVVLSLSAILAVGYVSSQVAEAQFSGGGESGAEPSLILSPDYPGPHTRVYARVEDFTINPLESQIEWRLNGEVIERGEGKTRTEFIVGQLGSEYVVEVTLRARDGIVLRKSRTVRIADVDIIIEADTSAPFFYMGRKLPANLAELRAVAIPHIYTNGSKRPATDLLYSWALDGDPIENGAGFGLSSINVKGPSVFDRARLRVRASTPDNKTIAERTISLRTYRGEILLYEDDPLFGPMYERALHKEFRLTKDEVVVLAEPFNFYQEGREKTTVLGWNLNGGRALPSANDERRMVLRVGEEAGVAELAVGLRDAADFLASASNVLLIRFGRLSSPI